MAVHGGRITAVGHDEVHALVGPGTEVVDLAGKLLLPGFLDAHVHPQGAGLELGLCHLADTVDPAEYLRRIRAYADEHPDAEWITVGRAADLVVLDRDPFTGPPADIAATRVLQTFVEGTRVHAAPDA